MILFKTIDYGNLYHYIKNGGKSDRMPRLRGNDRGGTHEELSYLLSQ